MTTRKRQPSTSKESVEDLVQSAQTSDSVEDILASVDQFIDGVYRDLSISLPLRPSNRNTNTMQPSTTLDESSNSSTSSSPPIQSSRTTSSPPNSSSSATTSSPPTDSSPISTSLPPTASSLPAISSPPITSSPLISRIERRHASPPSKRRMDAEIERINRVCESVDRSLRSIGVFVNSLSPSGISLNEVSNINLTTTTSPCSTLTQRGSQRHQPSTTGSNSSSIIDLSDSLSQVPIIPSQAISVHNDSDNDDVILVSANIPPVVDLCTPGSNQEAVPQSRFSSANYEQFNRRRLPTNDDDVSCVGPPTRRKRYTDSDKPLDTTNISNTSATSDDGRTRFMCPVCMDSCLQRQPTSTLCGHVFCKKCIEHAIACTHKCPMCNKKISKKQTFRIYL